MVGMNKAQKGWRGAVIYTRVSTGEQAEKGTSLDSQRDACRQKALALGLPIVAEYEDAGISGGFLTSRQGVMDALADISRFSRDAEHQQALLKQVRAAGGCLVFCDMTFDDSPSGDLMFGIVGGFAQWERQEIKRQTYGGRIERAQSGIQPNRSKSPYGYHVVTAADVLRGEFPATQLGRYEVLPTEAARVRAMFENYSSGLHSLAALARNLNLDGVPTKAGGEIWRPSTIRYLLTNPVYKGVAAFGKVDTVSDEARLQQINRKTGLPYVQTREMRPADPETWITWEAPSLVSEDVWDRVQEKLADNRRHRGGNPRRVRMLTGRVFCPECGSPCTPHCPGGSRAGRPAVYRCTRYQQMRTFRHETACVPTSDRVDRTEAAVLDALTDAMGRPGAVCGRWRPGSRRR